jgi:hypothetical protein
MGITISGGGSGGGGITVETDPTALKLTGGTLSGTLFLPTARNLLNEDLNIQSYNDTGAGTTYTHSFKPYDGTFQLAANGGGLRFPDSTVQTTAGLPITGGTATGKIVTTATISTAPLNIAVSTTPPTTTVAGDVWVGTNNIFFKDSTNVSRALLNSNSTNSIIASSTNPILRIQQTGTGDAFKVEDENPDTTPFVINQFGKVGIGVAPDATASLTVDATGIKFGANSTVQSVSAVVSATGTYNKEIPIQIDGVNYRISCRQL